jgi:hypothetical protein
MRCAAYAFLGLAFVGGPGSFGQESTLDGRYLYGQNCASCHGQTLKGNQTGCCAYRMIGCRRHLMTLPDTPGTIPTSN